MRSKLIPIICLVRVISMASDGPEKMEPVLNKGTYRLNGNFKTMFHIFDERKDALQHMGIDASNPNRPVFIFPRAKNGGWFFYSSGDAQRSLDGKMLTYPISLVMDLQYKLNFSYEAGECTIDYHSPQPTITCSTWRDASRKELAWQVVFVGNGTWMYSKDQ